jgi:PfaD family protein
VALSEEQLCWRPMMLLEELVTTYGASRVAWLAADGSRTEAAGVGGGLVAAVEAQGVGALASSLKVGETLVLEDETVVLSLIRAAKHARMRVEWRDGPTYEDQISVVAGQAPLASKPLSSTVTGTPSKVPLFRPVPGSVVTDLAAALHDTTTPLFVSESGVYREGTFGAGEPLVGLIPSVSVGDLGARSFSETHGVKAAYVAGAMAGGIASADLVIAMGQAGFIGFYGAGGLPVEVVEKDVVRIKEALGNTPAGFNLLHNPVEPKVEADTVALFLKHDCRFVSASAFMTLTAAIVRYRLTGIHKTQAGRIVCPNAVFAKVSRAEVAEPFMRPAPRALVEQCVTEGWLTQAQAALAAFVPMAEDITAEADSGGHTDRRPLVVLLPTLQRLRDRVMSEEAYAERGIALRIGAAGGIGDPQSAHGALAMGADYLLTGSINQSSVEAGTSDLVKTMISAAGMADVAQGPAPDMFEMGAHVQVLSRGSMYAQRASRLYDLYKRYPSMDAIPAKDREKIERTFFKRSLDEVWVGTEAYWRERDPAEVERANADPRHKMALTFRWYLGMTSRWARMGEVDRKRDFQIWCGPSMGSFNDWVADSWLAPLPARGVVAIAHAMLSGAAALVRVEAARTLGVVLPVNVNSPAPQRR